MFEYVLIVYMTMQDPMYIGHFENCAYADLYVKKHYQDAEYTSCLFEDYIYLPSTVTKTPIKYVP